MTRVITIQRLKILSDSVLLAALTILAYNLNLPSLTNGKPSEFGIQSFLNNVYGLASSFFVISIFWVLYSKILDYLREVDDIVILTSFVFFILVLLVPAFSRAQFQYGNLLSVISTALLQIINGSLLLFLWTYLGKRRRQLMSEKEQELSICNNRYMYSRLAVIPCVYLITIPLGFFVSIYISTIFPIVIAPAVISLGSLLSSKKKQQQNKKP